VERLPLWMHSTEQKFVDRLIYKKTPRGRKKEGHTIRFKRPGGKESSVLNAVFGGGGNLQKFKRGGEVSIWNNNFFWLRWHPTSRHKNHKTTKGGGCGGRPGKNQKLVLESIKPNKEDKNRKKKKRKV